MRMPEVCSTVTKKLIGAVEVDSGTVIIADPAYVMTKKRYEKIYDDIQWLKVQVPDALVLAGASADFMERYGEAIGAFAPQTVEPGIVVSRTQVGDGSFPVYAEYSDEGDLLGLTIRFDGEDEEG